MSDTASERAAALAALVAGVTVDEGGGTAPALERTGAEVYAGGDEARLLVMDAPSLGYVKGGLYIRAEAVRGDVVLLTQAQAARLDAAGATVSPDADVTEVAAQQAAGVPTDEELAAMGAAALVAYVGQHPAEAPRVREVELGKTAKNQRKSVIEATDPELLEAARLEAEAAAETGQQDPAAVHGPTADEVTQEQQDNNAPGSGE